MSTTTRTSRFTVFCFCALASLVSSCATDPVRGHVIDKEHQPGYVQLIPTGNNTTAPVYYPDSWRLRLAGRDRDGWREVPEGEYTACAVGSQYPACAKKAAK